MDSDITQTALFFKLWAWVDAHRRQVLWGGGILVVALCALGISIWSHGQRQSAANDMLSLVLNTSLPTGEPASAEAILRVATEYPGTPAAARALLLAADAYYSAGRYTDARAQFERYARENPDGPFVASALMGVAVTLEAEGKSAEAISAYREIVDRHSDDLVAPQAKLALGRLYEAQGDLGQARDYFLQIARPEFGALSAEAGAHLQRMMTHETPVPAPAAATNAPAPARIHPPLPATNRVEAVATPPLPAATNLPAAPFTLHSVEFTNPR